ncbi:uncharacterized protein EMH_0036580 [Eimeria mitis]|uniref:Uncharacterized protein n=1 Tax=Eimeria mitis TaxID=44415 RepID=U6K2T3_9EIME|nr:uncharacterized protein EMH_0036580 [Eimeria mitis]CDJ31291.1 hypothetical protein, conserved [Eimeria mitis]
MASYARGNFDLAALMSQQRFLRQQEQQLKAEVLRLSRTTPFALPQDRPLPPPPPQQPIERRIKPSAPSGWQVQAGDVGVLEGGPGCPRSSWRLGDRREDGEPGGMAAAIARRQQELQQQQRERQQLLQQQRSMQRPASWGASMEDLPRDGHEGSPYTFPTSSQESFPGLSRFPRSATVSLAWGEAEQGVSRAEKRHLARISPSSLPAAGMPSGGGRRKGEDGCPTGQRRRQVLPGYAAAASSPLLHEADAWPLHAAPRGDSREARSNNLPCGYAAAVGGRASQGPTGFNVPSTLPPSLHHEPEGFGFLSPTPLYQENNSKDVFVHAAGLPSQHCSRNDGSAALGPPRVGWNDQQLRPSENQKGKQISQHAGQRGASPIKRRPVDYTAEVAAGKPSSQLGSDMWGFRQSLRASDELKTSVGRQAPHTRAAAATISTNMTPHFAAATASAATDDEETLKRMGVNASPRELLFFRKQLNGRVTQQRQRSTSRRSRSNNSPAADRREITAPPLERGGCGGGGHFSRDVDTTLSAPNPGVWALPSWMRAYGVSGSPSPPYVHREDGRRQRRFPPSSCSAAPQAERSQLWPTDCLEEPPLPGWAEDAGDMRCGCRCCRMRATHAQEPGISPTADLPCCCCPCCSWWRMEGEGPPIVASSNKGLYADKTKEENDGGAPAALPAQAGKCSRCGKRSSVAASRLHAPQPGVAVSIAVDDRLPLEQAASLCTACAAYLACEREAQEAALAPRSGAAAHTGDPSPVVAHSADNNPSPLAVQTAASSSNQQDQQEDSAEAAATKEEQKEPESEQNVRLSAARQLCTSSEGPPESNRVWENPRVVSKICQYLSLSKLLLVRRCNKTFLQAAQYRMRFVLYNSLFLLMHEAEAGAAAAQLQQTKTKEGQHCPLSADALIQLLGLDEIEVEEVRAGNLPSACPPEAATPRMQDVAAALLKSLADLKATKETKSPGKPKGLKGQPITRKHQMQPAQPPPAPSRKYATQSGKQNGLTKPEVQQQERLQQQQLEQQLLDAHMAKQQAQEEAYLKMVQDQFDRPVNFGYDEAAGPVAAPCALPFEQSITGSPEPATFRRVRHAFLKLWNYDDEAFRQALIRATTTSYPTWLFDVSALLLRAVFQLCCNSLSAPPLKELIPLFSPKRRPPSKVDVPCRSDSYLWAKMARVSGYAMHLISDQAWPPLRDPVVRLVAQPFISPDVLTRGSGVDPHALYDAAAGGIAVTPLVLRPVVVDSLEVKMSKVSPEFISEFLEYGRQQQLIHSAEHPRSMHGGVRQFKASSELILMMDLYEWLASVLTHMQNTEDLPIMREKTSFSLCASRSENFRRNGAETGSDSSEDTSCSKKSSKEATAAFFITSSR